MYIQHQQVRFVLFTTWWANLWNFTLVNGGTYLILFISFTRQSFWIPNFRPKKWHWWMEERVLLRGSRNSVFCLLSQGGKKSNLAIASFNFFCISPLLLCFSCISPVFLLYFSCVSPKFLLYFYCISLVFLLYFTCISPVFLLYFSSGSPVYLLCQKKAGSGLPPTIASRCAKTPPPVLPVS